jgi:hypothetical protein
MGFFNILETFFFISLAITFVLIIMLVYHFKARLSNVENKYDTMFGIMHNMVGELKGIKKEIALCAGPCATTTAGCAAFGCLRPTASSDNASEENASDDDNYDENDENDENDDNESEHSTQDYYAPHNISYHTINDFDQPFIKIIVSDNEERGPLESETIDLLQDEVDHHLNETSEIPNDEPQENQTKVITIELSDNLEEVQADNSAQEEFTSVVEPNLSHIVINKIDETSVNESSDLVKKHDMIDYKKMDVSYLRTLVITRGLATDTKKLKKMELISLLEESDA